MQVQAGTQPSSCPAIASHLITIAQSKDTEVGISAMSGGDLLSSHLILMGPAQGEEGALPEH